MDEREGKSGSSIRQATPTGAHEGFDMTVIDGILALFAVGDYTWAWRSVVCGSD